MFPESTPASSELMPAQHSGVEQARQALASRGLVVIADVVGSGKSFIALQLIREALADRQRVLLTTPAALGPGWRRLLGKPMPVDWLSHTRMSLDDDRVQSIGCPQWIVVDEAHAFRNPATRRYRTLARLAVSARLVLLTATPINNSLLDLYFLLRLGLGDGTFVDRGVPHLGEAMRAAADRNGQLSPALRAALDSVVVRRSREALRRAGLGELRFPRRAPPVAVRYTLDDAHYGLVASSIKSISELQFAAFDTTQGGSSGALLAMTLLKRLESSLAAFSASLASLIRFYTLFLEGLAAGRVLRPGDVRGLADQFLLAPLVGAPLPRSIDARRLRMAAGADLHHLLILRDLWGSNSIADRKLDALCQLLDGTLKERRVLLFTEFRETASALWARLRSRSGVARIDGSAAWLGAGRASRLEVVHRFAPRSNGARPPPAREQVQLLIATDVLSEGLNLQDADTVVSFDLPWNPVRLIQRVGRIDRLGSPHEVVECYHFMPDQHLEDYLALVRRLCTKLEVIRAGLGEDEVVLGTSDASFLDRLVRGDATVLEAEAVGMDHWAELRVAPRANVVIPPDRVPVARLPGNGHAIVLVLGAPPPVRFLWIDGGQTRSLSAQESSVLIADALQLTIGQRLPNPHDLDDALARLDSSFGQRAELRASSVAGLAARRVLQLVRASADSDVLTRRADSLLGRLARGLRTGEEVAVRAWVRHSRTRPGGNGHVGRLLDELEGCLGALPGPTDVRDSVIAAFVIAIDCDFRSR
jgi:hypothetical protein